MDDAFLVGVLKCGCDISHEAPNLVEAHTTPIHPVLQRSTGVERHHNVGDALFLAIVEDRDDILVLKVFQQPDLAIKARPEFRLLRHMRSEHLDRHLFLLIEVAGLVHRGHSSLAYVFQELVTP